MGGIGLRYWGYLCILQVALSRVTWPSLDAELQNGLPASLSLLEAEALTMSACLS